MTTKATITLYFNAHAACAESHAVHSEMLMPLKAESVCRLSEMPITMESLDSVLMDYQTDLSRNEEDISVFLMKHFKRFIKDIVKNNSVYNINSVELSNICTDIVSVIDFFRNGKTVDAYQKSYGLFNNLENRLGYTNVYRTSVDSYYRIRPSLLKTNEKASMFHISIHNQNLIRPYRYSIAGQPCLYASSSIRQSWIECGMPREFSYVQLKITEQSNNNAALRFVDLSRNIKDVIDNKDVIESVNDINLTQVIEDYIYTYPLRVACSLKVKNKDDKFIAEYIIPQLLMQWIRDNNQYDGVKYRPLANSTLKTGEQIFNIALTTSKYRGDGLDKKLTSKIQVSNVEQIKIENSFRKHHGILLDIERFSSDFRKTVLGMKKKEPELVYIVDMCDAFVILFKKLEDGEFADQDIELAFHFIDTINNFRKFTELNKVSIINRLQQDKQKEKDIVSIKNYLEHLNNYFNNILKNDDLLFEHIKSKMRSFTYI